MVKKAQQHLRDFIFIFRESLKLVRDSNELQNKYLLHVLMLDNLNCAAGHGHIRYLQVGQFTDSR